DTVADGVRHRRLDAGQLRIGGVVDEHTTPAQSLICTEAFPRIARIDRNGVVGVCGHERPSFSGRGPDRSLHGLVARARSSPGAPGRCRVAVWPARYRWPMLGDGINRLEKGSDGADGGVARRT